MTRRVFARAIACLPRWMRGPLTRAMYARYGDALALNAETFRGRSVLLLGPARTLAEDLKDIDVSGYNVIVKMNNGLDTPAPLPAGHDLHCDVLFHSATSDVRPITEQKLAAAGVRTLVHRTPKRNSFLRTMLLDAAFGDDVDIRHVPWHEYTVLSQKLDGASPTTGFVAACFFLNAPIAKLAIVGFTFFSTAYQAGYDADETDAEAFDRVRAAGHHAPRSEARRLSERVAAARQAGTIVILGQGTEKAMQDAAIAGTSTKGADDDTQ